MGWVDQLWKGHSQQRKQYTHKYKEQEENQAEREERDHSLDLTYQDSDGAGDRSVRE